MAEAAMKAAAEERELTDGFHLIIDALKLNGVKTIYGVPGIPITDFGRMAQGAGIRVISFRHEQNAGYAAAIAGYLFDGVGAGLPERSDCARACDDELFSDDPDLGLIGTRDRRPAAGRLRR